MGCPHSQSQSQSHKLSFESLNLNLNFIKLLSSVSAAQGRQGLGHPGHQEMRRLRENALAIRSEEEKKK